MSWSSDDDNTEEEWKPGQSWDPDDDDDWETPDFPVEEDCLIPCPNCRSMIYDEAELCPVCGEAIERASGHYLDSKPRWFVILGTLGMIAVIVAILGGMF